MTTPGLIIVGSGPAGISAAESFRQHNSHDAIRILTDDPALPYARPPLSKEYLRGDAEVADAELHPAQWFDEKGIELIRTGSVNELDCAGQQLTAGGTDYPYRWLVLACGSKPSPFEVPGAELALKLRSLADAETLRNTAAEADSAVVIGAGFIGCEAAASLAMRGVSATLVSPDRVPQATRLGEDVGERILGLLTQAGARYAGSVSVTGLEEGVVHLDNGVSINCDLALAATGVQPQSALAISAGINTSDGRIVVDSHMRTSADNVFAAGDIAMAYNITAGRRLAVEHWQDAMDQGSIAGANAAGRPDEWDAVPGFWTTIGGATLKYHAWGDGFQRSRFIEHDDGFTVWYEVDDATVGVLTYNADDDYDRGEDLIRRRCPIQH
ncbi:NAD(P)/FAD-dependent oxidoreductase [Mycobacterium sp.]|uniref:NAD(P)/FAD-dependent oxidoreductase n=1 Tax=Mycobacterium sp. TaxID=1785 RepID=UPI003D09D6D9